jgi:hypothetical protein
MRILQVDEILQRLFAALHGTLGSYLRDALQEGSVDALACLPVPRAYVFSSFILFASWSPLSFLVLMYIYKSIKFLQEL